MTEAVLPKWFGYCSVRHEMEFNKEQGLEKLAVCLDTSESATKWRIPTCANCPVAHKRVQRLYEMGFAPGCPSPYGFPPGFRARDSGYRMVVPEKFHSTYFARIRREGVDSSSYILGVSLGYLFIKDVRDINGTN